MAFIAYFIPFIVYFSSESIVTMTKSLHFVWPRNIKIMKISSERQESGPYEWWLPRNENPDWMAEFEVDEGTYLALHGNSTSYHGFWCLFNLKFPC